MAEDETTYLLKSQAMRERLLSASEREEDLPPELERQVRALAAEDDETLWRMPRGRFSPAKSARLEELNFQRQAVIGTRIERKKQINWQARWSSTCICAPKPCPC